MFPLTKKTAVKRTLFFVLCDILFIALSVWLAFLIRFDGNIPEQYYIFITRMIALAVIFTIPIFYFLKLYSFSWSYVSTDEAISLFKGTLISFIFLSITIYISKYFPYFLNFPRSVIFISYILFFVFSGAIRFIKRIYLHILGVGRASKKERTLIVGAGDAGEQILRSIISSKDNSYYPVGFADDSPIKQNVTIHGLKVLGKIFDIPEIVKNHYIKQIIIALPSASNKIIKEAVDLARKSGVKKIKMSPDINDLIHGKISFKNLKDAKAEDLLGRNQIIIETKEIENFIKNKTILITGSAGSIGSELSKQTAKFCPANLLLLDQDETGIFNISNEISKDYPDLKVKSIVADITDKIKIKEIFKDLKPDIVFHAAAYKHVPLMEDQPDEAVKNNIFGTDNLAKECLNSAVEKFIMISTDKAVNPTSVMGATKRVSEMICQKYNKENKTKFISVRFGNVLDSRGSVIPIFREQIKKGGPVEVTHPEMKRYFMLIKEACLLVMQAGVMGEGGEVFVLDMGEAVKILDLAKEMIRLSGLDPDKDIAIVFTNPRPGEKLFEEILTAEEGTVATQNQKIFKAKLSDVKDGILENNLPLLKKAVEENSKENIYSLLKEIVPFYK